MKWEHLSILTPDCLLIYFAYLTGGRASPHELLDKLEGNTTGLFCFFSLCFFFFLSSPAQDR